jgi:glyoxylase-like metal-dependent hydrolase (beta-lactamase superfamily II)
MTAALPEYEIHAIRYARRDAVRREHFVGGDPHDSPMPMDYFVWCITGPAGAIVLDLGFTAEMAKARKREFLRCPIESLKLVGVDARDVNGVILSHMHYDHVGNFDKFRMPVSICRRARWLTRRASTCATSGRATAIMWRTWSAWSV